MTQRPDGPEEAERQREIHRQHSRSAAGPDTFMPPPPGNAPVDVSDAAPPPEIAAAETRRAEESQWELTLREFMKRKGAVAAAALILLLVTLSIFAPLFANDRPIAYRGANRYNYAESARNLTVLLPAAVRHGLEVIQHLEATLAAIEGQDGVPSQVTTELRAAIDASRSKTPSDLSALASAMEEMLPESEPVPAFLRTARSEIEAAQVAATRYGDAVRVIPQQIESMASGVVPDIATELRRIANEFSEAAAERFTDEEAAPLRRELRDYRPDDVTYVSRWHFPVFAVLGGTAVGFMVANLLVLGLLAWKLLRRRPWSKAFRKRAGWTLVLLPVIVGVVWALAVPELLDRTPYKQGVMAAKADERPNAPVIYEAVMWPPVPFGLDEVDLGRKFTPPEILGLVDKPRQTEFDGPHWLGTDPIGRDVLSRMLWGGRVSLSVGIVAVSIYVAIGIAVGAAAGFFRGWSDMVISRIIEIVIVFPTFFLILTIVAFLGPGMWKIMVVIGLTGWTGVARLIRGEFLRLTDQEFVLAGRVLGYSPARLIFRHILPNALAPVLVAATFGVAGAILTESALSFLGLGITVPTPSWGGMLSESRSSLSTAPWLMYLPGLAIFLTIMSYNLAGEALRDASDPRLRGGRA